MLDVARDLLAISYHHCQWFLSYHLILNAFCSILVKERVCATVVEKDQASCPYVPLTFDVLPAVIHSMV